MSNHETKDIMNSPVSSVQSNSTTSADQQGSAKKRKYLKVDYDIRVKLIVKVLFQRKSIRKAAREMGLNFSTGKAIVKIFRDEGRILKKCEQGDFNFTYQVFEGSVYKMLKEHDARRVKGKSKAADAATQEAVASILSQLKLLAKPKEKVEVAGTIAHNVNAAFQAHQFQNYMNPFMGMMPGAAFMMPTAQVQQQFNQHHQSFFPMFPGTQTTMQQQITNLVVASNTMQQRLQTDLETQLMFSRTQQQIPQQIQPQMQQIQQMQHMNLPQFPQQTQQTQQIQQLPTFQVTAPIVYNPGFKPMTPQLPSFQTTAALPSLFPQQNQQIQHQIQPAKSAVSNNSICFPFSTQQPLTTGLWGQGQFAGVGQF